MSEKLSQTFEERLQEIESYLDLLEALERQVQSGPPSIGGVTITALQQKILYSSVYVQLYNLVEATISWCIDAVCNATSSGQWRPGDLSAQLFQEWVRTTAQTHSNINDDKRLKTVVTMCRIFLDGTAIPDFSIDRRGNWDDQEIETIVTRLGFKLQISRSTLAGVKQPIRDDKGALSLIRDLRNRLGHGGISFSECGDGATVLDLRDLKNRTATYLREVVQAFRDYIDGHQYLIPEKRP